MSPTFLWVSKFDVNLGVGEHHFQNYHIHVSFQIWGSKVVFFLFYFYLNSLFFLKISKTFYPFKIKIAANILMGFKIWCQVGGRVTPFSKLPYSREFSNIWFQKSTDIRYKRRLWMIFWKLKKPSSIWVLVGVLIFD